MYSSNCPAVTSECEGIKVRTEDTDVRWNREDGSKLSGTLRATLKKLNLSAE